MKIIKCQCGYTCNMYRLSGAQAEGMFNKEEAQAIALAVNSHAKLVNMLEDIVKTWGKRNNEELSRVINEDARSILSLLRMEGNKCDADT